MYIAATAIDAAAVAATVAAAVAEATRAVSVCVCVWHKQIILSGSFFYKIKWYWCLRLYLKLIQSMMI